ncbi:alpha/beta fold hydrolase [Arthrobacter sp. CJ23]|uniref:alpha/beta fold hydrolase n=1 Tax=Arthrobacter sp. CJ23 TaxID=2972479 RepID=UPI00215CE23A|nr:alpha/beta hydrolase [Arthrobacter sp. CJ23]UVJ39471.1 alpha/beta hydrolase [Arthrobacter sp. CJ23]
MSVTQVTAASAKAALRLEFFPTELGRCAVRIQGARLRSSSSGAADVYLHGAAGSWTTFLPLLREAPAHDRVLIDLPGWGDSTAGARLEDFSIEAMGRVVVQVLDALGYRRWNLVGHSMGGFLALHIAADRPELTASVATISATTFGVHESIRRPLHGLPFFVGMLLLMRSTAVFGAAGRALVRALGNTPLMRLLLSPLFAVPAAIPVDVIRRLAADARPASFTAAVLAAARYDLGRWRGIRCPALAIRGDRDVFTPASDLDRLAQLIPHLQTATIRRCGHFATIEQPAHVTRLLEELGSH